MVEFIETTTFSVALITFGTALFYLTGRKSSLPGVFRGSAPAHYSASLTFRSVTRCGIASAGPSIPPRGLPCLNAACSAAAIYGYKKEINIKIEETKKKQKKQKKLKKLKIYLHAI